MKINVHHFKNKVEILIDGLPAIEFISDDVNLEDQDHYDFALWAILPILMRMGSYAECNFPVSRDCHDSVIAVSRVWTRWLPELFTELNFNIEIVDPKLSSEDRSLCFYSGGVDSTCSAIMLRQQGVTKLDCLTVHGMDYRFSDLEKFQALMDKTAAFRREMFDNSLTVRTNLYSVYDAIGCNPHDSHVTHIFALFACGSLFSDYGTYFIASDHRLDQQFSAFPYGSNSATNRLMRNANGRLTTCDDDVSRSEKVERLIQSGIDLSSLSICVDYESRPQNCGVCSKCVRTKTIFYAASKKVPSIFHDMSMRNDWYRSMSLNKKSDRIFFGDILDALRRHGLQNELGYSEASKLWKVALINERSKPFEVLSLRELMKMALKQLTLRISKQLKGR
jgi:7-cyano-7-deazaguanine synthase in queuosine biosynthesis